MKLTIQQKEDFKKSLITCLNSEAEIRKIILFGSFIKTDNPEDVDIAIIQDSSESYLALAMKYRKKTRPLSNKIPLDILPLRFGAKMNGFLREIYAGEVIYEK